jgi:hypothetical protein
MTSGPRRNVYSAGPTVAPSNDWWQVRTFTSPLPSGQPVARSSASNRPRTSRRTNGKP